MIKNISNVQKCLVYVLLIIQISCFPRLYVHVIVCFENILSYCCFITEAYQSFRDSYSVQSENRIFGPENMTVIGSRISVYFLSREKR